MLKSRGPLVLDLPAQAWYEVSLMRKDLRLALDAADSLDVPLPSAAVASQLYTAAQAMGHGRRDIAVMFEVFAEMAGRKDGAVPAPRTH